MGIDKARRNQRVAIVDDPNPGVRRAQVVPLTQRRDPAVLDQYATSRPVPCGLQPIGKRIAGKGQGLAEKKNRAHFGFFT